MSTAATAEGVSLMDSFWMGMERSVELQMAQIYGQAYAAKGIITINKLGVQQQLSSSVDCGIFAVAYAAEVCYSKDPTKANFHQDRIRGHLKECIEAKQITPFPKKSNRKKQHTVVKTGTIKIPITLYCYCHMPEDYDDMIQCDSCDTWFHKSCVHIPKGKKLVRDMTWNCVKCQGKKEPQPNALMKPLEFQPKHPAKKRLHK